MLPPHVAQVLHRLFVSDVDLDRGAVNVDKNKTDDPRTWALTPGVAPALRAWLELRAKLAGAPLPASAPLFVDQDGVRISGEGIYLAKQFRDHLGDAGIDRPSLFERSATRQQIRLHDLRATFVTLSLSNGRSETWVSDRTGHKASDQIAKYRRAARTAAELALGELTPLDVALPELAAPPSGGSDEGRRETATGKGNARGRNSKTAVPVHGFEP